MSHRGSERLHPDAHPDRIDFDPETGEVWYPLPSFPGYQFSSDLRLRTCRASRYRPKGQVWHVMEPMPFKRHGFSRVYLAYDLRVHGQKCRIFLHWLVAELAYGPRPDGLQVLHRDDDSDNNYASNLAYGTHAENVADALRHGRYRRGEEHGIAKYKPAEIREMREMFARGVPRKQIMARFGVSHGYLNAIARRRVWAHLD